MAGINLLPVCSECKKQIDVADISIGVEKEELAPGITAFGDLKLNPDRCPLCNARFTELALPEAVLKYIRRLEIEKNY